MTALPCLQPLTEQDNASGWKQINYEIQGEIRLQFNIFLHINIVPL